MRNELLGPYADEQAMLVPSSATPPDWSGQAWDHFMRTAIASGAITPPPGERERSYFGMVVLGALIGAVVVVPWFIWVVGR